MTATGPTPYNTQLALGEEPEDAPTSFRVLLTASRYLGKQAGEFDRLVRELIKLRNLDYSWRAGHPELAETILMHGGCPTGGDAIADGLWWGAWGMPTEVWLPDWDSCGSDCRDQDHRILRTPKDKVHPPSLWADEDARGADPWPSTRSSQWPILTPSAVRTYCPGAGPRRNLRMVAAAPSWCLALYGSFSKGSKQCAAAAKKAGVPTHVIEL